MRLRTIVFLAGSLIVVVIGVAVSLTQRKQEPPSNTTTSQANRAREATSANTALVTLTEADQAGKRLSNGRCQGTDKPKLTHLPMRSEDFTFILPYGLMIGGHVTPIDHQYFSPTNFQSPPDSYDVYAMADSRIVDIGTRQHPGFGANANRTVTDYRIVFTISCRLFYYYDLVTSLAPDIQAAFEAQGREIDLPVTAGQLIGKIGGQTLDFAVWDTDRKLPGLIAPNYGAELWKLYTVDPLEYYTNELKAQALAKYLRTAEPRSGKIDYDVEGKLIGNWFAEGTNWYNGVVGEGNGEYWVGHLALAPDYLDPTQFVISIGNWPGGAEQFAAKGIVPNPATVGLESGLVKYDLAQINYRAGGAIWDRMSLAGPITMEAGPTIFGCMIVELTGMRTLKAEAFKGKPCSSVSGFTDAAAVYVR